MFYFLRASSENNKCHALDGSNVCTRRDTPSDLPHLPFEDDDSSAERTGVASDIGERRDVVGPRRACLPACPHWMLKTQSRAEALCFISDISMRVSH